MIDKIVCAINFFDQPLINENHTKPPVIFLKPPSVLKACQQWNTMLQAYLLPDLTFFECELVFKIGKGGYRMTEQQARSALTHYSIGLDMTLMRDFEQQKKAGYPWAISKVFPDAAIIGPWLPVESIEAIPSFRFSLDGSLRQESHVSKMSINPVELLIYASRHFYIAEGDILFTGTPSGIGPVNEASVGKLEIGDFKFSVAWSQQHVDSINR